MQKVNEYPLPDGNIKGLNHLIEKMPNGHHLRINVRSEGTLISIKSKCSSRTSPNTLCFARVDS